jgi:hypothetical protein
LLLCRFALAEATYSRALLADPTSFVLHGTRMRAQ